MQGVQGVPSVQSVSNTSHDTVPTLVLPLQRPRRHAASEALCRMKAIGAWEAASENSQMFRLIAQQIDNELETEEGRLQPDELQQLEAKKVFPPPAADASDADGNAGNADGDEACSNSDDGEECDDDQEFDDDKYESSFIDDSSCDESAQDSDEEWAMRKRKRTSQVLSLQSDSSDYMTTSDEEEDTDSLSALDAQPSGPCDTVSDAASESPASAPAPQFTCVNHNTSDNSRATCRAASFSFEDAALLPETAAPLHLDVPEFGDAGAEAHFDACSEQTMERPMELPPALSPATEKELNAWWA